MAEQIGLEKVNFPIRFEDDPPEIDPINNEMHDAERSLRRACEPYTNQSPYRFLLRFLTTLVPIAGRP